MKRLSMACISKFSRLLLLLFTICILPWVTKAQTFDYEWRPTLDFKFIEAQIDLQLNPDEGSIIGSVIYNLQASGNDADTLILDAPGIEIDSVRSIGKPADYKKENDALKIRVTDSSEMGENYQIEIFYRTRPEFGLLKSSDGTMWTSLLPRSNSHWVPVKDHPRVAMTTTLTLQIPANVTAFASGVRTDREVLSTSLKKVTFRTGRPVPITALNFGFGQFREEGTSVGIKRIDSYAETGSVSVDEQGHLVEEAKQLLGEVEQSTGVDYPFQRLNVVIMNDHYWEQKPYGASTIFIYKNRGDLTNQLQRGVYGQWFGVYQNEEQWAESWPVYALQTALHYDLYDSAALLNENKAGPEMVSPTVYDKFNADQWNQWQQSYFSSPNNGQINEQLILQMLQKGGGVITPQSFKSLWYHITGQPDIKLSSFISSDASTQNSPSSDSTCYRVDYIVSDSTGQLQMIFQSQKNTLQQPVTFPVKFMTGSSVEDTEITISGARDSVSLSMPANGTRGVYLAMPIDQPIILEEHKPVPFLLYQLRNAETTEARRRAALQLGYHTDNPDLQLALNDLMKQKMAPEVEAALLRSYGKITAGAEGTQQRLLGALESESPEVQVAALDVLGNYSDPSVSQRLRSLAENEPNEQLSNEALGIYLQQVDSTAALKFTNMLVQQDTSGTKAIRAIEALGNKGNVEQAVKLAGYYIEPVYAYTVRKQALQVLLNHDQSAENWEQRASALLSDYDPRIRFLIVKNLERIPGVDSGEILTSKMKQEFDARVYKAMTEKERQ